MRKTNEDTSVERLMSVAELAEVLGTGDRFVRRLVAERRIRFVKVGKHVRFPLSAVRDFIEAGTVPATRRCA